jgi:hypothetical protein
MKAAEAESSRLSETISTLNEKITTLQVENMKLACSTQVCDTL